MRPFEAAHRIKAFTAIFIPLALLILVVGENIASRQRDSEQKEIALRELNVTQLGKRAFDDILLAFISDGVTLAHLITIEEMGHASIEAALPHLQRLILSFISNHHIYDQVQVLDTTGMEILRVNYDKKNKNFFLVPKDQLQNKANRDYFIKGIRAETPLYVSAFDLNIENGKVEHPLNPMIRIAYPLRDEDGSKTGVIILNALGQNLLKELGSIGSNSVGSLYLVNDKGQWLKGPSRESDWLFMFDNAVSTSMPLDHPDEWGRISQKEEGQLTTRNGLYSFSTIDARNLKSPYFIAQHNVQAEEIWKIISYVPVKDLSPIWWTNYNRLQIVLIVGAAILSWIIAVLYAHRSQAIRDLKKSEQQLSAITHTALDGIFMTDEDGTIVFWNPAAEHMFGFSEKEAIGHKPHEIVAPQELREKVDRNISSFVRTLINKKTEFMALHKNGSEFPVELNTNVAIRDGKSWYIGVVRDVSDWKNAQSEIMSLNETLESRVAERTADLRSIQEKTNLLLESTSEGIFGVDMDENLTFVNRAADSILRYEPGELIGKNVHDIILHNTEDGEVCRDCPLINAYRTGEHEFVDHDQMMRSDGSKFLVEYSAVPMRSEGVLVGAVIIFRDITQRKKDEQALREERELLRNILDTSPIAVVFSANDILKYANPAFVEQFGYNIGETIPDKYVNRADRDYIIQVLKREGRITNFEVKLLDKDANIRHMLISYLPASYNAEEGILGWMLDITEHKEVEQRIRENEERLRFSLVAMGAYYWVDDIVEQTINYDSFQFFIQYGYTEAESPRTLDEFASFIHPDDTKSTYDKVQEHIDGKTSMFRSEFRFRKKDGSYAWTYNVGRIIERNSDGETVKIARLSLDISDRKKLEQEMADARGNAEKSLRQLETSQGELLKLSKAIEASLASVVVTDANANIEYVNPAFVDITGYTLEEIYGQNPRVLNAGRQPDSFYQNLWQIISSGASWHGEFCNRKKDGSIFWEAASVSPIQNSQGNITHYVAVKEDITRKRRAQEALHEALDRAEKATKIKSAFLANMSHEIRTPMNSILGFVELVLEDATLEKTQHQLLSFAHSSAKDLLELINDILDVSKLESGKTILELNPFSLRDVVENTMRSLKFSAVEKGINLNLNISPEIIDIVVGDAIRLKQILTNLVGNAIKFTEKGSVDIDIEPEGTEDMIRFSIRDTGIGISFDRQSIIFEPFTQADGSTSRQYGGTGLGTTIARQLAELMGGRIWLNSKPGQGSTFFFTARLPASESAISSIPTSTQKKQTDLPPSIRRFKILMAEDIESNRALAQIRLLQAGHTLTMVQNGLEVIKEFERESYDVILMDIQMPDMDGVEATKRIRAIEKKKGAAPLPIIALTASVMREDLKTHIAVGISATCPKPIDFYQLYSIMEDAIPEGVGTLGSETVKKLTSEDISRFPEISGIHIKDGLKIWRNSEKYRQALIKFGRDNRDTIQNLKGFLKNEQYDEISRICHNLKGLAGNLSIIKVSRLAQDINQKLKTERPEDFEPLILALETSLKEVLQGIASIPAEISETDAIRLKPASKKRVEAILKDILQSLELFNPDATLPHMGKMRQFIDPERLRAMTDNIENFNFEKAKSETIKLAAELNIKLEIEYE